MKEVQGRSAFANSFKSWDDPALYKGIRESQWQGKLRRHQSWYRESILKEPPGRFRGKERPNWLTDEAIAHDPSLNFLRDKEILDVVEHRLAVSGEVSSIRIASNGICFPANPSASTCSVISRSIWMLQRKY